MVAIDNIKIEYFIDYLGNRIHLLERGENVQYTLPNVISPEFMKKLVDKEHLLMDVLGFEWVIYCSNKLVMTYRSYNLSIIGKTEKWLHGPFVDVLEAK